MAHIRASFIQGPEIHVTLGLDESFTDESYSSGLLFGELPHVSKIN